MLSFLIKWLCPDVWADGWVSSSTLLCFLGSGRGFGRSDYSTSNGNVSLLFFYYILNPLIRLGWLHINFLLFQEVKMEELKMVRGVHCLLSFRLKWFLKLEKEIEHERNKFEPLPLNLFVSQTGCTGGSRGGRGCRGGRGGRGGGCSKDFFLIKFWVLLQWVLTATTVF